MQSAKAGSFEGEEFSLAMTVPAIGPTSGICSYVEVANSSWIFSIALGINTLKCGLHVPLKRLANNVDIQNPMSVSAVSLKDGMF